MITRMLVIVSSLWGGVTPTGRGLGMFEPHGPQPVHLAGGRGSVPHAPRGEEQKGAGENRTERAKGVHFCSFTAFILADARTSC